MRQPSPRKCGYRFRYEMQQTNEIYNRYGPLTPLSPTRLAPQLHSIHSPQLSLPPNPPPITPQPPSQQPPLDCKSSLSVKKPFIVIQDETNKQAGKLINESQLDIGSSVLEDSPSHPRRHKSKESRLANTAASKASKKREHLESQQSKASFSRKGLALISSLILEVLQHSFKQNRRFSCGEISGRVLEEFCRRTGGEAVDEKERKTIKRRVYDSINVLIALGKIKKEQKWLYVEPADPTLGLEIIKAKGQTLGTLGMELINKHQSFSRAKRQYEQLKALKSRNESLKQFNSVYMQDQQSRLQFPLLLFYSDPNSKLQLHLQRQGEPNASDYQERTMVSAFPLYVLSEMSALEALSLEGASFQGQSRGEKELVLAQQ